MRTPDAFAEALLIDRSRAQRLAFAYQERNQGMPKKQETDNADFAAFCRNATNRQLVEIELKERKAGRSGFADIARAESERRDS